MQIQKPQLIIAEDFKFIFDSKLDAHGRNPSIKKNINILNLKKIMTYVKYGE